MSVPSAAAAATAMPRRALLVVTLFVGITAVGGGALLIASPDGAMLGMPPSIMRGAFGDFLVPGLLLAVVVGGSNLLAAWATLRCWTNAPAIAGFAGAIITGFVAVEIAILGVFAVLHAIYLLAGVTTLLLAWLLARRGRTAPTEPPGPPQRWVTTRP